jgi:hypothetical protein
VTPIAFDDTQITALDLFISGKTERTREANAPASDAGTIARLSRIDHFIIAIAALRTAHGVVAENPLHYKW